jgi:MFS family permease
LHDPQEIERVKGESVTAHAAVRDEPEPRPAAGFNPLALWALWTAATTAGLAIGSLPLAAFLALRPAAWVWLGILLLPVAGACMGAAQWLVLRRRIALSARWIWQSAVLVVLLPFTLASALSISELSSVLERHLRNVSAWRRTTALACLAALLGAGLLFLGRLLSASCSIGGRFNCQPVTSPGWWLWTVELTALVAGLIVGAVTGTALVSLLDQETVEL